VKFVKDSTLSAEGESFDDSGWRLLDLPHDWSIEDLPDEESAGGIGPFSRLSPGGFSTGHTLGGVGWYRKRFTMENLKDEAVAVCFDGVYMDCDVWINGRHLGGHPYGYTPFFFDLTAGLHPAGVENVLAVRVRNLGRNSRWYSGSGIYRHVTLTVTSPVHVPPWGISITTPEAAADRAIVRVAVNMRNDTGDDAAVSVRTIIVRPNGGKSEASVTRSTIPARGTVETVQEVRIFKPSLWSPASPSMYRADVEIISGGRTVDRTSSAFGIRSIRFDVREDSSER
jgi:beta-galactosidase